MNTAIFVLAVLSAVGVSALAFDAVRNGQARAWVRIGGLMLFAVLGLWLLLVVALVVLELVTGFYNFE